MKTASILLFLMFFFGYLFGTAGTVFFTNLKTPSLSPAGQFSGVDVSSVLFENLTNETNIVTATIKVPAVNQDKEGVATVLTVGVVPGSGRTLVNIDKLLFWVDTQSSIRTSREVAGRITGIDIGTIDTIYTIIADASVIEGGSAGAALTIATISALRDVPLDESVMITGTINSDGTIGPVGEALAKARVAKELGATKFLVPRSQSTQIVYNDEENCEQIGISSICRNEQVPHRINIGEEAGIEVIEVYTINDAARHFFGE